MTKHPGFLSLFYPTSGNIRKIASVSNGLVTKRDGERYEPIYSNPWIVVAGTQTKLFMLNCFVKYVPYIKLFCLYQANSHEFY